MIEPRNQGFVAIVEEYHEASDNLPRMSSCYPGACSLVSADPESISTMPGTTVCKLPTFPSCTSAPEIRLCLPERRDRRTLRALVACAIALPPSVAVAFLFRPGVLRRPLLMLLSSVVAHERPRGGRLGKRCRPDLPASGLYILHSDTGRERSKRPAVPPFRDHLCGPSEAHRGHASP